jgi:hypothetical protein
MGWGGGRGWGGGGFGFGRGRGWGRGFGGGPGFGWGPGWGVGYGYYPPPSAEDEAKFLRAESATLKQHLEDIDKRLAELEKED